MVLSEYLADLSQRGVIVTDAKVRHAIKCGRIPRPRLNAAHQFDFSMADVEAAVVHFTAKSKEVAPCS